MVDHFVNVQVLVPRADSSQRFIGTESATCAATDVIFAEQRTLCSRELHEQFLHSDIGIDRRGGIHRGANLQAEAQCYNFAGSANRSTMRLSNRPAPPPSRLR